MNTSPSPTVSPRLCLIAAADLDRVIGKDNDLPWDLPGDVQRFKAHTLGKPLIMGRRTWQSLGRPLPKRPHLVVSRDADVAAAFPAVVVVPTLQDAITQAAPLGPVAMIVGGAGIYAAAMPLADEMILSVVHSRFDGDTRFPCPDDGWFIHEARRFDDDAVPVTEFFLRRDRKKADGHDAVPFRWPSA